MIGCHVINRRVNPLLITADQFVVSAKIALLRLLHELKILHAGSLSVFRFFHMRLFNARGLAHIQSFPSPLNGAADSPSPPLRVKGRFMVSGPFARPSLSVCCPT